MDDRTALMSAKALDPGYQITWYTIRETLGQGGFGITYLAYDNNLDREVAIKEYLPTAFAHRHVDYSVKPITSDHLEHYSWGLNNFLKEAKTLAKFNHDNIVRVHTVFEANNTAYMVMEYEQGENLASIIKERGSITQDFQKKIFYPIIEGLTKIHELGFIHRDIKPANIYIRANGSPVLIDFGSARQTALQETGEFTALISQGYTPLEQYSADYGEQGPWTDLYALAATIYHGITGAKPDDTLSRSARMLRSQPDRVTPLSASDNPGYEQQFLDATFAGLSLQPEHRPQSLANWLEHFQGTSTTSTGVSESTAEDDIDLSFDTENFSDADFQNQARTDKKTENGSRKSALLITLTITAIALVSIFIFLQQSNSSNNTTNQATGNESRITDTQTASTSVVDTSATSTVKPTEESITSSSAPIAVATAEKTVREIFIDKPLPEDTNIPARTILQLTSTSPVFPPVEGLDESAWKGQNCASCHDWTKDNLCEQGKFYISRNESSIQRISHPFGGLLKSALKVWAEQGCR
ncbi:MAG: protein kinase [Granulosicoccus sp.]|nr:protein kinase [Granulosicoccus sp.]